MNPIKLDQSYQEFTSNLASWIPEGIIDVDLQLLEEVLLDCIYLHQESMFVQSQPAGPSSVNRKSA